MFTLEYSNGYYISKNGDGVIDFVDPDNREFAEFVVNALNAGEQCNEYNFADPGQKCDHAELEQASKYFGCSDGSDINDIVYCNYFQKSLIAWYKRAIGPVVK